MSASSLIMDYLNAHENPNRIEITGRVTGICNLRNDEDGNWCFDISWQKTRSSSSTLSRDDVMVWLHERISNLEEAKEKAD
jgi:hypothetical protein